MRQRQIVLVSATAQARLAARVEQLRGPLRVVSLSVWPGALTFVNFALVLEGEADQALEWEKELNELLGPA